MEMKVFSHNKCTFSGKLSLELVSQRKMRSAALVPSLQVLAAILPEAANRADHESAQLFNKAVVTSLYTVATS